MIDFPPLPILAAFQDASRDAGPAQTAVVTKLRMRNNINMRNPISRLPCVGESWLVVARPLPRYHSSIMELVLAISVLIAATHQSSLANQ